MPETHRKAIKQIGFGGLLSLDMEKHYSSLAKHIVNSFNADTYSLMLQRGMQIHISKEDVYAVYGVPLGGLEVVEPTDESEDNWAKFLEDWRKKFNLGTDKSPTLAMVVEELQRLMKLPVCDDFVRHFVLCAVNCCMRSKSNRFLRYEFMYSCMDVGRIRNHDWCGYVHRHVGESIEEWKATRSFTYFTGPLPFLMVSR